MGLGGLWDDIGRVAKAVMKSSFGDNASIAKAFADENMNFGMSAMNKNMNAQRRSLVDSAIANKIVVNYGGKQQALTRAIFDEAAKDKDFNLSKFITQTKLGSLDSGNASFKQAQTAYIDKLKKYQTARATGNVEEFFGRKPGTGPGIGATLSGYFGDEVYGGTRTAVTLGGTAAGAVGMRYLSGGNLTTDAQGQRNIAGIPFI